MNSAPSPARFYFFRFAAWLAAGAVLAALLAWLRVKLETADVNPVGLISMLPGAGLGIGLVLLMRLLGTGHRISLRLGTLFLAMIVVGAQFWFLHREYVAQLEAGIRKNPKGAFFRDSEEEEFLPGFKKWFLATAREKTVYWIVDGALVSAAALAIVWFGTRAPYCNGCRSWYRTSRSGPLGRSAATQLALAAAADCSLPADAEGLEYRLISCRTGCGPARIELSWKEAGLERRSHHWIDRTARTQVEALLNN